MIQRWSEVQARYQDFSRLGPAFSGMHALISQISASALSQQLYCWLSMHDLCIVQTEVSYPYNGPLLRVSPLSNGAIEFRYEDTAIKERQWCRQVLPEEASAQLAKFLAQLHWLSSSVGAAANKSFKADA